MERMEWNGGRWVYIEICAGRCQGKGKGEGRGGREMGIVNRWGIGRGMERGRGSTGYIRSLPGTNNPQKQKVPRQRGAGESRAVDVC